MLPLSGLDKQAQEHQGGKLLRMGRRPASNLWLPKGQPCTTSAKGVILLKDACETSVAYALAMLLCSACFGGGHTAPCMLQTHDNPAVCQCTRFCQLSMKRPKSNHGYTNRKTTTLKQPANLLLIQCRQPQSRPANQPRGNQARTAGKSRQQNAPKFMPNAGNQPAPQRNAPKAFNNPPTLRVTIDNPRAQRPAPVSLHKIATTIEECFILHVLKGRLLHDVQLRCRLLFVGSICGRHATV